MVQKLQKIQKLVGPYWSSTCLTLHQSTFDLLMYSVLLNLGKIHVGYGVLTICNVQKELLKILLSYIGDNQKLFSRKEMQFSS